MRKHCLILFFILSCIFCLKAKDTKLTLHLMDCRNACIEEYKDSIITIYTSKPVAEELTKILEKLHFKGFVGASIDSVYCIDRQCKELLVDLYVGNLISSYQHTMLEKGVVKDENIEQYHDVFQESIVDKVIKMENNGYPFAKISVDNLKIKDEHLILGTTIKRHNLYKLDSIQVTGSNKLPKYYIERFLNIQEGMLYDESQIRQINGLLKKMPQVTIKQPYQMIFYDSTSKLNLFIDHKKTNQFDGLIGFQSHKDGPIGLTGNVSLKMRNALHFGENFSIIWKRFLQSSQQLNVSGEIPYILHSSFGVNFLLDIQQIDSTQLTTIQQAGIAYLFNGDNYLRVITSKEQNSVLKSSQVSNNRNVTNSLIGLGIQIDNTSYNKNVQKGVFFESEFSYGDRKIQTDSLDILLPQNNTIYKLSANVNYYQPVWKRMSVLFGGKTQGKYSASLYENESYRIGGFSTIRGFDEGVFLVSKYVAGIIECRYQIEQNSFFYVFNDNGWLIDTQNAETSTHSIGVGVQFKTNSGLFSFNYALGRIDDQGFEYRDAKVQFGFISYF